MNHILYVEDDDLKFRAVARLLKHSGVLLIRAHTFSEACDHFLIHGGNGSIRFVLSDWSFPFDERGGLAEACMGEHVVKMAKDHGVPFAVFSGHSRPRDFDGTWVNTADRELMAAMIAVLREARQEHAV